MTFQYLEGAWCITVLLLKGAWRITTATDFSSFRGHNQLAESGIIFHEKVEALSKNILSVLFTTAYAVELRGININISIIGIGRSL